MIASTALFVTVPVGNDANGAITSQPAPKGQTQSVSGTTTGTPDSGTILWPADTTVANTVNQGPFPLTLGNGTFSDIDRALAPGTYLAPVVTFTIAAGTSFPAAGGSVVIINGISGYPQAPESVSTVAPANLQLLVTTIVGTTVQISGTVTFANNDSTGSLVAYVDANGSVVSGPYPVTITGTTWVSNIMLPSGLSNVRLVTTATAGSVTVLSGNLVVLSVAGTPKLPV